MSALTIPPNSISIPKPSAVKVLMCISLLIDDDFIKMGKSVKIYNSDNDCIHRIDLELEKHLPVNEWYFFDPAVGKAIPDDLCGIRNSLVHAASLPDGFMLIPDKSHFTTSLFYKNPKIIAITQFITAIENTLNDIDKNLHFTPASKYSNRSIINITNLTTTSGSSGGSQ